MKKSTVALAALVTALFVVPVISAYAEDAPSAPTTNESCKNTCGGCKGATSCNGCKDAACGSCKGSKQ